MHPRLKQQIISTAVFTVIAMVTNPIASNAQTLNPDELRQLLLKAQAMTFSGHSAVAIPLFKQIIAADPNNSQAYSGLGWASYQLGKVDTAISHQRKAVKLDPLNPEPHYFLAAIYMSQKQYQSAASEQTIAAELSRKRPCNCKHPQQLLNELKSPPATH